MLLPLGFALALALFGWSVLAGQGLLLRACLSAAGVAGLWALALLVSARRQGRTFTLGFALYKHHWVQALAQIVVYAWWGWYVRVVYAYLPLLFAQVLFAYAVDALLTWSRRDRYSLGFGPLPVIGSINLFLWFRPEWFHFQFAMIAVGYLGKELIRWTRDGRSAHIFNPSSFPLALVSMVLIATGASDITFGNLIANTQHDPPFIYLAIFLAALPGQLLFGVARMTLAAVVTMVVFGWAYFQATGTYFFYDSFIPVPVFLGMHLLFTDPSTSPRSELGRVGFGVLYALGTLVFYVLLTRGGIPTFYDKLLPVPLMNLTVRGIDGVVAKGGLRALDPSRVGRTLTPARRNTLWAGIWTLVFVALIGTRALGDRHPGQYLPFWANACAQGSERACDYATFLTLAYCNNGSGWACNEVGIQAAALRQDPRLHFSRGCDGGFEPACENARRAAAGRGDWVRESPTLADLPIVLRGTKPALRERDPGRLLALACEQGWEGMCRPAS
ncbi:MAG: hypothetical protein R3E10_19255 [Gemmatimonadota bacterium]